jgi:hypothetical protein
MAARARPPPSPDAIAAANARAADSARPAQSNPHANNPPSTFQRALEAQQGSESDMWSVGSNPSVSSFNSSTREMHRRAIASAFFGLMSTATEAIAETDERDEPVSQRSIDSNMSSDRGQRRRRRREDSGDGIFRRVFRNA